MIRSFKHRALKRLYERGERRGLRPNLAGRIERILSALDVATAPHALNLPGFRLHALKGDLAGYWSVAVNANWRITFRFDGEDASDVDLVDYH